MIDKLEEEINCDFIENYLEFNSIKEELKFNIYSKLKIQNFMKIIIHNNNEEEKLTYKFLVIRPDFVIEFIN